MSDLQVWKSSIRLRSGEWLPIALPRHLSLGVVQIPRKRRDEIHPWIVEVYEATESQSPVWVGRSFPNGQKTGRWVLVGASPTLPDGEKSPSGAYGRRET